MKGGVKASSARTSLEKAKPNRGIKIYRNTKRNTFGKQKYRVKSKLKTLKRKIKETEEDTTDIGVIKSFLLCKKFIKTFLKRYDAIMNSNNQEKRANYSVVATMLATKLSEVVKEYDRIIDDEDLQINTNNDEVMDMLLSEPEEYLENFIDFIDDDNTVKDFANIVMKYSNSLNKNNKNKMMINNNNNNNENIKDDYLEYYGFLHDTSKGVISVIKEFSLDLKVNNKIAENVDIDSLIMGLTAIKIKGVNVPKENIKVIIENSKNNSLNDEFFSRFMKLGL